MDEIMELQHLRKLNLSGDTPPHIFFQIKNLFHVLESVGSARIEGNHTTLIDYIDAKVEDGASKPESIQEIINIERAMNYIDSSVQEKAPISNHLIHELHQLTVDGLKREGDKTPGAYRQHKVKISKSKHVPPDPILVQEYMDELIAFINEETDSKYDLLKIALAHHRFAWIHPFGNGNGRAVRLLTYALFIKFGFAVNVAGRVLNPTAVFCNNRDQYYQMLSLADIGGDQELIDWCTYMLSGIRHELSKVDHLTDYTYLKGKILIPALRHAKERGIINASEEGILKFGIEKGEFKSGDLIEVLPNLTDRKRAYILKKLIDAGMIAPIKKASRYYQVAFSSNKLTRSVIMCLSEQGFTTALDQ